jgi:hypothetical protein
MTLEDTILHNLGKQMSDSVDRQVIDEFRLEGEGYKMIPFYSWVYDDPHVKAWVEECLPNCKFMYNKLYYKNEADATLFRLRWK